MSTVINSGSFATIASGVSLPSIGCIKRLEKSGSITPNPLYCDGGMVLASPSLNALAASIVCCGARLLTITVIPSPNPWSAAQSGYPLKLTRFRGASFHLAPPEYRSSLPKMVSISPQVSSVSWSCEWLIPQTYKPTRCPEKGLSSFTSSNADLASSFDLGPWATMFCSTIPICADAASRRLSSPSAFVSRAASRCWASCSALAASVADCFASPTSLESNAARRSFTLLISVSTPPICPSTYSSPATPTATSAAPRSSNINLNRLGLTTVRLFFEKIA